MARWSSHALILLRSDNAARARRILSKFGRDSMNSRPLTVCWTNARSGSIFHGLRMVREIHFPRTSAVKPSRYQQGLPLFRDEGESSSTYLLEMSNTLRVQPF